MREIIFKAKRLDNNEWVEGYYFCDSSGDSYISSPNRKGQVIKQVIRKTLCQYTGLNDKHGNKIFEGDLVNIKDNWHNEFHYEIKELKGFCQYVVNCSGYLNLAFIYNHISEKHKKIYKKTIGEYAELGEWMYKHFELIGNIHDNEI